MTISDIALKLHEKWQGKYQISLKSPLITKEDLAIAYTPGVAEPCKAISKNEKLAYKYTSKANTIAIITDGSAVLGLGDIGPTAGLPVMEGKAILFKQFGDVNAIPICLATKDVDEIIKTVKYLAPAFGGINLEDISGPRCFEIEQRLINELSIPVFHDDQHGTAIVVLAGLINALKIVKKEPKKIKIVINGAGAAGIAITKLLLLAGFVDIIICDTKGIINSDRTDLSPIKKEIAEITNKNNLNGNLATALINSDVFIGVSAPNIVNEQMVKSMNKSAIIFAMSNPIPEIMPDLAKKAGARIIGTGRSDFPNQINNVLAFPGIFKGVLKCQAPKITEEMKLASAKAIADIISPTELNEDYIIPNVFDADVAEKVALAIINCHKNYRIN